MSAIFTYVLFVACLGVIAFLIIYSIKFNKRIKDISVSPISIILSIFFFMALWLADLTTLNMSTSALGIKATNALIPSTHAQVPAIAIWAVCIISMFLINYFYRKMTKMKKNVPYSAIERFLAITQITGIIIFAVFAAILILAGHGSSVLGLYIIGIYHAMLPLIIIPQIILALMIK